MPDRAGGRPGRGATFRGFVSLGVVDPRPDSTGSTTEAQLRRIVGGDLGRRLRAEIALWHPEFTVDEIDDAIQTACNYAAEGGIDGVAEGEVYTWLRITAHRWLKRELANRRELPVAPDAAVLDAHRQAPSAEQRAIELEDLRDGTVLVERVVTKLNARQRTILALHLAGHNRPRIASELGMTDRTVKRQLERIMANARDELGQLAGGGCEDGETLVMRLACGIADAAQATQAKAHVAHCGRCADFSRALDTWREKAAAILPLPATETATPGLVERTLHGAADGLARAKQQLADTAIALRQGATDGGAQLKQQAASAYYRVVDPTPLAGVRPGAAATVIVGCLAIGGGAATYCATEDFDPFGAGIGLIKPAPDRDQPADKDPPATNKPDLAETVAAPAPAPGPESAPAEPAPDPAPEPTAETQAEAAPETAQPQPAPPSGSDSLSGLTGNPTPTPAPAPPPAPTVSGSDGGGGSGSAGTDFGGL